MYKKILGLMLILSVGTHGFIYAQSDTVPVQVFEPCRNAHDEFFAVVDSINTNGWAEFSQADYDDFKQIYINCHETNKTKFNSYVNDGSDAIQKGNYDDAVADYERALTLVEKDTYNLTSSIISLYLSMAREAYQRGDYDRVEEMLDGIKPYRPSERQNFQLYYIRALLAVANDNFSSAKLLAEKAADYVSTQVEADELDTFISYVTNRALAPTNDQLSYQQPWLNGLNITDVWQQYTPKEQVVVAVIDNGIDTAHPDLQGRIRNNSKEIPNNGKDDDNNGYIDDTHGYNFFTNSADITPLGDHGTQVAGIIGAVADNKVGVAGIAQKVEMMSLVVCNNEYCLQSNQLANPIRYAVDNGADVINMSLVSKNATFNPVLNDAIDYAVEHGVIVVIAAGNGIGEEDQKVGVNTTTTPVSPVCNEGTDKKRIIGVGASNEAGQRLSRSNYGDCVDIYTYGERLVTASLQSSDDARYLIADGTSFSAPIIVGLIALGQSIAGDKSYTNVYDALIASLEGSAHPDALTYLSLLGSKPNDTSTKPTTTTSTPTTTPTSISTEKLTQIDTLFKLIDRKFALSNPIVKRQSYTAYLKALDGYETKLQANNDTVRLALLVEIRTRFQQRLNAL